MKIYQKVLINREYRQPLFKNGYPRSFTSVFVEGWSNLGKRPEGSSRRMPFCWAQVAAEQGITRMSAQAVGGAVGHNPLSIIVPCHRVVGANGSLTGYAGGIVSAAMDGEGCAEAIC